MALSCRAQVIQDTTNETIVPLEQQTDDLLILQRPYYLEDVNNVLDKFIGTWTGAYNNLNYTFIISDKDILSINGVRRDILRMRFKITDTSGNILEDTTNLPDDSPYTSFGKYIDTSGQSYHLTYIGQRSDCGHGGEFIISVGHNNNPNLMQLYIVVRGESFNAERCPDYANHPVLLPKHTDPQALFTKQ